LAKGESKGSYSAVSWSNRLGTVLTPVSEPSVYSADRPFYWNRIDVGGRMTVIQLSSSSTENNGKPDLWVHSPVGLDEDLISAIDELGTVKHVVSPNYEHVKYAKQWADQYPNANIWGCPGLMERETHVRWTGELPFDCRPPTYNDSKATTSKENMWDWNEIQPLHLNIETNPFTGKPFFNEVLFYHAPSKSLLTTDFYWNYPSSTGITNEEHESLPGGSKSKLANEEEGLDFGVWKLAPKVDEVPTGSRLWKFGMDKIYKPFYFNLMVKTDQRDEFEKMTSFILGTSEASGWDIETLIPAHGDIVRGRTLVRTVLRKFCNL